MTPNAKPRLHQDSGFACVLHGNAIEHPPRRRRTLRRLWRALLRWLRQPSPWDARP